MGSRLIFSQPLLLSAIKSNLTGWARGREYCWGHVVFAPFPTGTLETGASEQTRQLTALRLRHWATSLAGVLLLCHPDERSPEAAMSFIR